MHCTVYNEANSVVLTKLKASIFSQEWRLTWKFCTRERKAKNSPAGWILIQQLFLTLISRRLIKLSRSPKLVPASSFCIFYNSSCLCPSLLSQCITERAFPQSSLSCITSTYSKKTVIFSSTPLPPFVHWNPLPSCPEWLNLLRSIILFSRWAARFRPLCHLRSVPTYPPKKPSSTFLFLSPNLIPQTEVCVLKSQCQGYSVCQLSALVFTSKTIIHWWYSWYFIFI